MLLTYVTLAVYILRIVDQLGSRCTQYLQRYQHSYPMFNEYVLKRSIEWVGLVVTNISGTDDSDIQGTGAVILGGFINAARHSASASGKELRDQRIVFMGAGSAGVGVAKQLLSFFLNLGLSEEAAKERVWLVDTKVCVCLLRPFCIHNMYWRDFFFCVLIRA